MVQSNLDSNNQEKIQDNPEIQEDRVNSQNNQGRVKVLQKSQKWSFQYYLEEIQRKKTRKEKAQINQNKVLPAVIIKIIILKRSILEIK